MITLVRLNFAGCSVIPDIYFVFRLHRNGFCGAFVKLKILFSTKNIVHLGGLCGSREESKVICLKSINAEYLLSIQNSRLEYDILHFKY